MLLPFGALQFSQFSLWPAQVQERALDSLSFPDAVLPRTSFCRMRKNFDGIFPVFWELCLKTDVETQYLMNALQSQTTFVNLSPSITSCLSENGCVGFLLLLSQISTNLAAIKFIISQCWRSKVQNRSLWGQSQSVRLAAFLPKWQSVFASAFSSYSLGHVSFHLQSQQPRHSNLRFCPYITCDSRFTAFPFAYKDPVITLAPPE